MKRIILWAFLPLLMLVCCCSDDGDDLKTTPANGTLTVAPEALKLPFAEGMTEVVVTSDTEWAVLADNGWCKLSPTGGIKGTTKLKITVEKNASGQVRVATLTFKLGSKSQTYNVTQREEVKAVTIPDAQFNAYCLAHFDTDQDGVFSEKEAAEVTTVDVSAKNIASLQGIELFTALTTLNCAGNSLQELRVASLKKLSLLNCSKNNLSQLDIQSNINLTSMDCTGNSALTQVLVWTGFKPTEAFKKPSTASFVEPAIPTPPGYALLWQDEFNDAYLSDGKPAMPDTKEWWYETGGNGWGNNELQNYIAGNIGTDTCAIVSDGTLKIKIKRRGSDVFSVRMNTNKSWTYGYFEARLKLPQGKGTWPAFWMMPKNYKAWPDDGEIDIMEEVGYRPNWISSSIHCKAYYHKVGTQKTAEKFIATAESDFHVYALEWTPTYIWGYIDGECFFKFANDMKGNKDTWPFNEPFYIKLNLAWGGDWGGAQGVDESKLPATYEIDYVRVFQK